jgi:hypothetical protein
VLGQSPSGASVQSRSPGPVREVARVGDDLGRRQASGGAGFGERACRRSRVDAAALEDADGGGWAVAISAI